jgi:hypothetical protein
VDQGSSKRAPDVGTGEAITQIVPLPRARAPRGTNQPHRADTEDEVTVVFARPARSF